MAADAPAVPTLEEQPMTRAREWWIIAPPALLLFAKAGATVGRIPDPIASLMRGEAILEVTFALLALVAAIGLLARRRIGWLLALTIVGWDLALAIVLWWRGTPNYLTMGLLVLAAAFITSNEMRRLFARRDEPR